MKKRIKIGSGILTILSIIALLLTSSCSTPKVYTARNSGFTGKSGSHVAAKTQKHHNFEAAMNRSKPKKFLIF